MHGVTRVEDDAERADALDVRYAVFVDEQGVPEDVEVDEHEADATHYVAYVDGNPVGAARYREHDDETVKVERVAVRESHRGEGWGAHLMDAVETDAREAGYERAVLHAQTPVVGFYEARGYEVIGETFEEAGIPHVEMAKPL
ncbi:GNAT family N-acetyltransferase [Halarchaeum sp. CBA1220]|uniref:GNAT family N-acetyltransferase n=1 Tax=Halarchaeum sp. CBA1220 TaxID=1853682 RepID=UPI000F3A9F8C|nr:GNAT family N-acetyltransferase [Halarchaeum sp. CBA1220]QLC34270.1 GNAT family N-acetyltransferase [Halarchaeum sp. CBA1220]